MFLFVLDRRREYGDEFSTLVIQRGGSRWAFVTTGAKYQGKTAHDVSLGASRADIEKSYCGPAASPDQTCGTELRSAAGTFLHFPKARTIFLSDDQGRVVRWTIYAVR